MRLIGLLSFAAALMPAAAATAQTSDGVFKIGILTDQNGIYSYVTGRGTVEAVRLAVADNGGKVLGRTIEVLVADDQNKADIASSIARRWFDEDKVDVILAGAGSAAAIAIVNVAKEKNKTVLMSGPGSSDLTGKLCTPVSTHWAWDTYALAASVAKAVVEDGGKSWFFVTADYSFGHALERDATRFIETGGGKVVGVARHPLGSPDFSSYLVTARGSGASVIGLANAGGDLVNTIKQAGEFGIAQGGQRLAGLLLYVNDIQALGLPVARGIVGAASFYHDQSEETRAWTARYVQRFPGNNIPNMVHAGAYAAVNHYLKAAQAAGTVAAEPVNQKMREMPVNDFYNKNVRLRGDGRVLHDMMLWQTKLPDESKGPFDLLSIRKTIPGSEAFRSEGESECPLLKK